MAQDDVLVKLVIKGMDPADVVRLAQSTSGELAVQMGKHFQKITELHALMRKDMDAAEKKSVQDQIKEETKLLDATKKVYNDMEREATKAANATRTAWRRTMEDLENFTVVFQGFWGTAMGGLHKFKELGEESARLTNIYGSLTGSIEEMVKATDGQVSNTDLILTKNRALEKDLKLTDEQFGIVAAQADRFADALGINTKDALDSLVDGLATGRKKMLEHVGVVINAETVYREYAKGIGVSTERLTDHEKILAMTQASLKEMDKLMVKNAGSLKTFADDWEKTTAQIQNLWDKMLLKFGEFIQRLEYGATHGVPMAMAKLRDAIHDYTPIGLLQDIGPNKRKQGYEAELRARLAAEDAKEAADAAARVDAAKARLADPNAYTQPRDKALEDANRKPDTKGDAERKRFQAEMEKTFRIMFGHKKGEMDTTGYDSSFDLYPNLANMGLGGDFGGSEGILQADKNSELDKLMGGQSGDLKQFLDKFTKDFVEPLTSKVTATESEKKAASEAAGGGLMARLLFGPDGPDKTLEQMDAFEKASVQSMGMIADAGTHMAEALGASLAASIAGSAGAKKSIRDTTHAVLEGLAAQALTRALFETASGIADLAMYNLPGAALHFAAAAAFGAIGVGSGLASRAVGQDSPSGAAGASSGGGGGFTSGPRNSNDNGNQGGRPIVINVSGAIPGSEAEIGRNIAKALNAHAREAGGDILDQRRSA